MRRYFVADRMYFVVAGYMEKIPDRRRNRRLTQLVRIMISSGRSHVD
jgi:hypothetical protein